MKISCGVFLCWSAAVAFAESPFDKELAQLREQRDKALAAASEPVNRRYQAALEQTLHRAMQANDLDAAVKIKASLAELGAPGPAVASEGRSPLQLLMDGSRWEWFNAAEPKGPGGNWVEFYKDGTGRAGWNQPLRYTITGPNTLRVFQGESATGWAFVMDLGKREGRPDPAAAGGQPHSMKLEKRIPPVNPAR